MFAVNHTTHQVFEMTDIASEKVQKMAANCKKKFKGALYRVAIKGTVFSFVETLENAKALQAMLHLHGAAN